jgi:hypothetical protein
LNKLGLNKPSPGLIEKVIRGRLIQKNNQVVRKRAFYWRYDTAAELELLNQLRLLVSARLNFAIPTKKPVGHATANGHRQWIYDQPRTPWQRVKNSKLLAEQEIEIVEERIIGINPADLTRQINLIQTQLTALARDKTQPAITKRQLDMACLVTINQSTKPN